MGILAPTADERVTGVKFTKDTLSVGLRDGRTITVPLAWYPRLFNATAAQRKNWQVAGGGYGIHWPDLDEDLSTEGLLRGGACSALGAGQGSIQHWPPDQTLHLIGASLTYTCANWGSRQFGGKDNVMANKGASRVRYRSGDVFQIPFSEGSFGYGRILLDLRVLAKAGLFSDRCALTGIYGSSLLIQVYRMVAAKPLASMEALRSAETLLDEFLRKDQIYRAVFPIVGNLPVMAHELDFPEYVCSFHENPGWHFSFQKGAIVAKLAIDLQESENLPKGSVSFGLVPAQVQQRITDPEFARKLASGNDLRIDHRRKRILALAGLKPRMTYDQMCEAVGGVKASELLA